MKGRWPLCIIECLFKSPRDVNVLGHLEQTNGLVPECILMCLDKLVFLENDLVHTLHVYGFTPKKTTQDKYNVFLMNHKKYLIYIE